VIGGLVAVDDADYAAHCKRWKDLSGTMESRARYLAARIRFQGDFVVKKATIGFTLLECNARACMVSVVWMCCAMLTPC
jgi:hypothetical protein